MESETRDSLPIYIADNENAEVLRGKTHEVFWDEKQAEKVAGFLLGNEVKDQILDNTAMEALTARVSERVDSAKLDDVMVRAKEVIPQEKSTITVDVVGDTKEEYVWTARETVKSVLSQIERSLRSVGMWSEKDYRRRVVSADIRSTKSTFGLETNARGFKHKAKVPVIREGGEGLELVPANIDDGLLPHTEGGPRVASRILTPEFNTDKPMKVGRFVRGLAHEVAHEIRLWANQALWEKTDAGFEGKLLKRSNVAAYGYQVGSNLLGAESVGMLSGLVAEEMVINGGKEPSLNDIMPLVAKKLVKTSESERGEDRYDVALMGLFDHVDQLIKLGCGEKSTMDLLALGCCGYVTYEKLPLLISTGVIDHEVFAKMKIVLKEVFDIFVK